VDDDESEDESGDEKGSDIAPFFISTASVSLVVSRPRAYGRLARFAVAK
jgi:hypothetical protein